MKRFTKFAILLLALAVLSPAGALAPSHRCAPPRPDLVRATGATRTASRRHFIHTAATVTATSLLTMELVVPILPAQAKHGASSTMELPNYIDYLIEKNSQGLDAEDRLYQGADPSVLLQRIKQANERLDQVPALVADKKWSQIQGLLTGPLGTLGQTLNTLVQEQPKNKRLAMTAKQVKTVLIGIGQAAVSKNAEQCTHGAAQAQQELQTFVALAFDDESSSS